MLRTGKEALAGNAVLGRCGNWRIRFLGGQASCSSKLARTGNKNCWPMGFAESPAPFSGEAGCSHLAPTSPENGIPPAPFIPLRQITEPTLGAADSKPSMMSRQRLRGTSFSLLERTQHCPSCFSTISDQSFPAPRLLPHFPYLSNLLDVSIVFDSRI